MSEELEEIETESPQTDAERSSPEGDQRLALLEAIIYVAEEPLDAKQMPLSASGI